MRDKTLFRSSSFLKVAAERANDAIYYIRRGDNPNIKSGPERMFSSKRKIKELRKLEHIKSQLEPFRKESVGIVFEVAGNNFQVVDVDDQGKIKLKILLESYVKNTHWTRENKEGELMRQLKHLPRLRDLGEKAKKLHKLIIQNRRTLYDPTKTPVENFPQTIVLHEEEINAENAENEYNINETNEGELVYVEFNDFIYFPTKYYKNVILLNGFDYFKDGEDNILIRHPSTPPHSTPHSTSPSDQLFFTLDDLDTMYA